jgi:hypothetical protein
MSSSNPPYPYYDGIPFNPSFFTSDTGGLSQATANNLYLRKSVPDTATAQETFSLGIKAQKVDGLLSSSIMYVGNNITSGSLILGNTGIRTKNQGIFEAYSIRTPATTGQLAICTDLVAGGSVEIGSVNGTVNLLGSASGGVNVPTSGGVSTNAVNVAYLTSQLTNVATLNQVQIFTGTNTFNNNSVTFGRPLTVSYSPSLITSSSMIGYSISTAVALFTLTNAGQAYSVTNVSITAGVWFLSGNAIFPVSVGTYGQLSISSTNNVLNNTLLAKVSPVSDSVGANVSGMVSVSTTTTYYLVAQVGTGATIGNINFQAVRIA